MESVRNPPPPPALAAWTRYWRAGALHSCGGAFAGNYAGSVADFWNAQLEPLADGSRVVDLGTGNGAIPLLARDAALRLGRTWEIHGVDRAAIDPAASVADGARRYAGIRFHPGVAAERLPFADAGIDFASGHYALEYMPRDAASAEVARVLGRRGRAAFVLHARDSLLATTTVEQLGHCRLLFEDSVVFAHARLMVQVLANASTPEQRRALADDTRAHALRHDLNEAVGQVVDRIEQSASADLLRNALGAISATLQGAAQLGEAAALERLAQHEAELRDEWDRLLDLDEAALDERAIGALRERFVALGYGATAIGRLRQAPDIELGWTLVVA